MFSHGSHARMRWDRVGDDAQRTALFINEMLGGVFSRIWMVLSVMALIKIASAMSLKAKVEAYEELKDEFTHEEREALVARIKRKTLRTCPMVCPVTKMMERRGPS